MHAYRRGDRGPAVAEIRAKLALLGLLADEPGSPGTAEDVFDDACDHSSVRPAPQLWVFLVALIVLASIAFTR